MADNAVLEAMPSAFADSKWIAAGPPRRRVAAVAARVLDVRLRAVFQALPPAALKCDEDLEHVHRLRTSARRAAEGVKIFADLLGGDAVKALLDRLRQVRVAADAARNWDVIAQQLAGGENVPEEILEQIRRQRRDAQGPILAVHQEVIDHAWEAGVAELVEEVKSQSSGKARRRFDCQAPQYLAPAVKKFFKAADGDLAIDQALHALRIRVKKLRYRMEIVASAFDSAFRKRLYPQVAAIQDLLGTVNDHATAKALLCQLWSTIEDAPQRAFLAGLLVAEGKAIADLRGAFLAVCTAKGLARLKRQFDAYC